MKKWMAIAALTLFVSTAIAQDVAVEPEFNDVFAGLDSGKLVPLERETGTIHAGGGGFVVANSKASYEFPGSKSPVRFSSAHPLDFVVRSAFASSSVDPGTFYVLRKLEAKKKTRELTFMSGHFSPVGGSMNTNLSQGVIPVTFAKYGTSSFKVTTSALAPGEYALSMANGQTVFCFGTD